MYEMFFVLSRKTLRFYNSADCICADCNYNALGMKKNRDMFEWVAMGYLNGKKERVYLGCPAIRLEGLR